MTPDLRRIALQEWDFQAQLADKCNRVLTREDIIDAILKSCQKKLYHYDPTTN